jgi:tripeptide aminopeptidase
MNNHDRAIELACQLQQIPAPTFHEADRAEYMRLLFSHAGLKNVEIDEVGNTWGCLPGGDQRPLVVSAHLDTVHSSGTPLALIRTPGQITGPAIGDNALGLSALVCIAEDFIRSGACLPGPVYFIATVGEEGMGNLAGMQAVVDRLGSRPAAYIILEGIGLGSVYHRALGVERYQLRVETQGGHSWADYGRPSAIHELAQIIARLSSLSFPKKPRTTFNIGTIQGGTSINSIAMNAVCTIDIRSEDHGMLQKTAARIARMIANHSQPEVGIRFELIGTRPAGEIPSNHPLVLLSIDCLKQLGVQPYTGIGSTDANVPLSRGFAAVCLGITTGGNAHTIHEYIHTRPVQTGLQQLSDVIQRAWETVR